jgi:hypothetical protein
MRTALSVPVLLAATATTDHWLEFGQVQIGLGQAFALDPQMDMRLALRVILRLEGVGRGRRVGRPQLLRLGREQPARGYTRIGGGGRGQRGAIPQATVPPGTPGLILAESGRGAGQGSGLAGRLRYSRGRAHLLLNRELLRFIAINCGSHSCRLRDGGQRSARRDGRAAIRNRSPGKNYG